MMTVYEQYAIDHRDDAVDIIEECHIMMILFMPIQDADLCWHYLGEHFYHNRGPYNEEN